jgi:hypothetical protein
VSSQRSSTGIPITEWLSCSAQASQSVTTCVHVNVSEMWVVTHNDTPLISIDVKKPKHSRMPDQRDNVRSGTYSSGHDCNTAMQKNAAKHSVHAQIHAPSPIAAQCVKHE